MSAGPKLIVRMGTHAEKEYVEKLSKNLDGVFFGANLVEGTPGATASLVVTLLSRRAEFEYYVDPMTYAFGLYADRATRQPMQKLKWLKADTKGRKSPLTTPHGIKPAYVELASAYGTDFNSAVTNDQAIAAASLAASATLVDTCVRVAQYQITRLRDEFDSDPEFRSVADNLLPPRAIIAPYFYIDPHNTQPWLDVNARLIRETIKAVRAGTVTGIHNDHPVHAILCFDASSLTNDAFTEQIVSAVKNEAPDGVWLWISRFFEEAAPTIDLVKFRSLVERLGSICEVNNLHGGFLSLALSKSGMSRVSQGVGYGEQKDVLPVLGQSVPTVRYYLPAMRRRLGVPQIERAFDAMQVVAPDDFHRLVCGCLICKGNVKTDVRTEFGKFGERRFSKPDSQRESQTPAAAKRCRFHFLLNRINERDKIASSSLSEIVTWLVKGSRTWGTQPSLNDDATHLSRWAEFLDPIEAKRAREDPNTEAWEWTES